MKLGEVSTRAAIPFQINVLARGLCQWDIPAGHSCVQSGLFAAFQQHLPSPLAASQAAAPGEQAGPAEKVVEESDLLQTGISLATWRSTGHSLSARPAATPARSAELRFWLS